MVEMTRVLANDFMANVDAIDTLGNTPLHYACQIENSHMALSITEILLRGKPKLHEAANKQGKKPQDLAKSNQVVRKIEAYKVQYNILHSETKMK